MTCRHHTIHALAAFLSGSNVHFVDFDRANEVMEPVHDHMPVVLVPGEEPTRLSGDADEARKGCDPYDEDDMVAYEISTTVNNPGSEDSAVIEQADTGIRDRRFLTRAVDYRPAL